MHIRQYLDLTNMSLKELAIRADVDKQHLGAVSRLRSRASTHLAKRLCHVSGGLITEEEILLPEKYGVKVVKAKRGTKLKIKPKPAEVEA